MKDNLNKYAALALVVAFPAVSFGQGKKDKEEAAPSVRVLHHFQKKYPNAGEEVWSRDEQGVLEAKFKLDGEEYRAGFYENGSWVQTEKDMDYKDLPESVKVAVAEQGFNESDVVEVDWVDHPRRGVHFDVEVETAGTKLGLLISDQGTILGKEEVGDE